jgi:LuxR family maltose regulon positive regulatory protein
VERLLKTPNLSPAVISQAEARKAGFWLRQGDLGAAARWARENGLSIDDPIRPETLTQYVNLARVLIADEELAGASHLLGALYRHLEHAGHAWGMIETRLLQALAASDAPTARAYVSEALAMAGPENFLRVFLDKGEPMAALLRRLAAQGGNNTEGAYITRLLAAFGDERPSALSEREFEILKYIAAGMSNREIADKLIVTVETVKWHVKNIYRKLNVTTRTQALARAKRLELL